MFCGWTKASAFRLQVSLYLPDHVTPVFVQVVSPPLGWSLLSPFLVIWSPRCDMRGPSIVFVAIDVPCPGPFHFSHIADYMYDFFLCLTQMFFFICPHICRGRNKPKLSLVRRISDMLQTVRLHVHLSRYLSILLDPNWTLSIIKIAAIIYKGRHVSHSFLSEVFELEIVIINAKIMYWTHFPDLFRVSVPLNVRHFGYNSQYFSQVLRQTIGSISTNSHTRRENYCHQFVAFV